MSAHSSAPWRMLAKQASGRVKGCRSIYALGSDRQCSRYNEIAYTVGLADDAEDFANARLIVAAPALLEIALRLERWGQGIPVELMEATRAALLLVTGKKSGW